MNQNSENENWLVSELSEPTIEDDGFSKSVINQIAKQQNKRCWRLVDLFIIVCVGLVGALLFIPSNSGLSEGQAQSLVDLSVISQLTEMSSGGIFAVLAVLASFTLIWLIEEFELL